MIKRYLPTVGRARLQSRVFGYLPKNSFLESVHGASEITSPRLRHRSGQARVTINGRDHYLGPHGSQASKKEYDRIVAEYLASDRSPSFGISNVVYTVAMLMRDYLHHAKAYYGEGVNSEWHRIKLPCAVLKELYMDLPADEFGPDQFKVVRKRMVDQGCKPRKLKNGEKSYKPNSRSTVNAHGKRIVRMFKWGASEGKFAPLVYDRLRLVPSLRRGRTNANETSAVKPVADSVVQATILKLPETVADMVRLQLLVGCRPSELCKLTPSLFNRTCDVWTAELDQHKTAHHGHSRILYFGPKAQAIVSKYINDRGVSDPLFRPVDTEALIRERRRRERISPPTTGNRTGTNRKKDPKRKPGAAYTTAAYAKAVARAALAAAVDHWSPNQLRHSRATLIRSMFGLEATAATLGHSEIAVTQVYAEQDRTKAIEVARAIG